MPHSIRFALGAALMSVAVLACVWFGAASKVVFGLLGIAALGGLFFFRRLPSGGNPRTGPFFVVIAVPYAVLYLVHTLAPETQADAMAYHLGLVREWVRLGGFPNRIGFYELIPQGMEMLFGFAYTFGGAVAAKLVHLMLFLASLAMILLLARKLNLPACAGPAAAVIYACSPVVAVNATAAMNDAALVTFLLAAAWLMLCWSEEHEGWLAASAGLAAGFCYAVKLAGGLVPLLALGYLSSKRAWRHALLFGGMAAVSVGPWLIRSYVMTGNPLAPVGNRLFRNDAFPPSVDDQLSAYWRTYGGVRAPEIPLELAVRGQRLQGLLGPLILLFPLSLLGLRRRAQAILLCLGTILLIPYALNIGARFTMPALPFFALALCAWLPRWGALAAAATHAVICWPWVVALYAAPYAPRLQSFPWRAALHWEPEAAYVQREVSEYAMAERLNQTVRPGTKVLDFGSTPQLYTDATVLGPWQMPATARAQEALIFAQFRQAWLEEWRTHEQQRPASAVRVRLETVEATAWNVQELALYRSGERLRPDHRWTVAAWPNVTGATLTSDANWLTRWSATMPLRLGMFVEFAFDEPVLLDEVRMTCPVREMGGRLSVYVRDPVGGWHRLPPMQSRLLPATDLRQSPARYLRAAGMPYLILPSDNSWPGELRREIDENPAAWGVQRVAEDMGQVLYHVR